MKRNWSWTGDFYRNNTLLGGGNRRIAILLLTLAIAAMSAAAATNSSPTLSSGLLRASPTNQPGYVLRTAVAPVASANPFPSSNYLARLQQGQPGPRPQFEMTDQRLTAKGGVHSVVFDANLNQSGAIAITLPDQTQLIGHVTTLAVSDATGKRVWLAQLKESNLQPRTDGKYRVWYIDVFDKIKADVRYTYGLSFLEQDVILRENLVLPDGLDAASAKFEVWTEFANLPEPQQTIRNIRLRTDPAIENKHGTVFAQDARLRFGQMRLADGQAFPVVINKSAAPAGKIPIAKQWVLHDQRAFLVESIDFLSMKPMLESLPAASPARPGVAAAKPAGAGWSMAADTTPEAPGVVLDYILVYDAIINVNFGAAPSVVKTGPAAAGTGPDDYWNRYYQPWISPGTLPTLDYADGTQASGSLVVENAPGVWGNQTGDLMFDTYIYPWDWNSTITI